MASIYSSNFTLSSITDRGYTSHVQRNTVFESKVHQKQDVEPIPITKEIGKHLDKFGLINANARMYEPLTGKFLAPDPYVQAPDYSQSFNRYTYCWNNPVKYSDPSGEIIFTAAALLIPGAQFLLPIAIATDIGWMTGGLRAEMQDKNFWDGAWKGAVVGAIGGSISMIGGAGMPFAYNLLLGTGQGAITGGLDAALWGNDIGEGMLWGAAGGALMTTLTSENLKNAIKGEGFYTNKNVFDRMMQGTSNRDYTCDEILSYFGFEGKFDPTRNNPGAVDIKGNIYYNEVAFEKNYDYLKLVATEENFHKIDLLSGNYSDVNWNDPVEKMINQGIGEHKAKMFLYKNQGLFRNHNHDLVKYINQYGIDAGYYLTEKELFKYKTWHLLYKIPRRW